MNLKLKLVSDWKRVLKKAWSVRLMLAAGLLSGLELVLPLYADALPRGVFAAMSTLTVAGAFVARMLAQKEFSDDS